MSNEGSSASTPPRRKALGRGLNALLESRTAAAQPVPTQAGAAPAVPAGQQLRQIPLEAIEPNPDQPRKKFAAESLEELAGSIRRHGLLQPIVVTPVLRPGAAGRFQLVAGERRWRAAQRAGLKTVPALVKETRRDQSLELALIENLQREDLNPVEAAGAFDRLAREFGLTHEEIAQRTGKDRATITNFVRLLKLPPQVLQLLADGKLTAGHAKALLGLDSAAEQQRLAELVAKDDLSVRATEKLVAHTTEAAKKQTLGEVRQEKRVDPNIRAAVSELERLLGTRVRLAGTARKGRLVIEYYSPEDLMRIYDAIIKS